jgi:hypothetical protein
MAIVCLKNSGDNPLRKTELAINYPSPVGFADGLRGGDRDYGMIRDRSDVLGRMRWWCWWLPGVPTVSWGVAERRSATWKEGER